MPYDQRPTPIGKSPRVLPGPALHRPCICRTFHATGRAKPRGFARPNRISAARAKPISMRGNTFRTDAPHPPGQNPLNPEPHEVLHADAKPTAQNSPRMSPQSPAPSPQSPVPSPELVEGQPPDASVAAASRRANFADCEISAGHKNASRRTGRNARCHELSSRFVLILRTTAARSSIGNTGANSNCADYRARSGKASPTKDADAVDATPVPTIYLPSEHSSRWNDARATNRLQGRRPRR
jgi:hypothetical protein